MASSLVGVNITELTFELFFILLSIEQPKAAVLPVPVCACPIRSYPSIARGIASA